MTVLEANPVQKKLFERGMRVLHARFGDRLKSVCTDQCAQIGKWMREQMPSVHHTFDVWHIAKGLMKKIMDTSTKRESPILSH